MNVIDFTRKLQQQAERASQAVKSFNFDNMAAQDEYIHSDSLNVKNRQHGDAPQPPRQPQHLSANGDMWSLLDRQLSALSGSSEPQQAALPVDSDVEANGAARRDRSRHSVQMLPVVQDTLNQTQPSSLSPDSDPEQQLSDHSCVFSDSDDSGGDDDDPIMRHIRRPPKLQPALKKKSNRFMEDLDDRMAKKNTPLPAVVDRSPFTNESRTSPLPTASALLSGLFGRKKLYQDHSTEMAPLARKKQQFQAKEENEDDFHTVVSSSVLLPDELSELNQLKSASPGWKATLLMLVREHPRESFIVGTLVLCVIAFFRLHWIGDNLH